MKHTFKLLACLAVLAISAIALTNHPAPAAPSAHAEISSGLSAAPADNGFLTFSLAPLFFGAVGGIVNARTLRDVNLQAVAALPAAAATGYTASIDTVNVNPGRLDDVEMLILLPATPNLVDAKTITLTLQDSADNVTFADVTDRPAQVLTGAGGVGASALSYQFKAPIGMKRYVRLKMAVLTAGGNNTAVSATLAFVF